MKDAAYSIPVTAPLYGRLPYLYRGCPQLLVPFRSTADVVRRLVPEPLVPNPDDLMFLMIGQMNSDEFGTNREAFLAVPSSFGTLEGNYAVALYLDNDAAIASGREVWGWPKKAADFRIEEADGVVRAAATRDGVEIISARLEIVGPAGPDDLRMNPTWFNLKLIPSIVPDAAPEVMQITLTTLENVRASEARRGPASVTFASTGADPAGGPDRGPRGARGSAFPPRLRPHAGRGGPRLPGERGDAGAGPPRGCLRKPDRGPRPRAPVGPGLLEQLAAVRLRDGGDVLPVGLLVGRRRQRARLRGHAHVAHQSLEAAGRHDEQHPAAVGRRPCSGAGCHAGRRRQSPALAWIVLSPTSNVTSPSRIQKVSSSRWWTCRGAGRAGRLGDLDDAQQAARLLGGERDLGQAGEPPARLSLALAGQRRLERLRVVGHASSFSGLRQVQERDRDAPRAVRRAAHDVDPRGGHDERRLARLQYAAQAGDVGVGRRSTARRRLGRSPRRRVPRGRPRAPSRRTRRTACRTRRDRAPRRRPRTASRAPPASALLNPWRRR